jgi:hypothetical protein
MQGNVHLRESVGSAAGFAAYMEDENHRNHVGKLINTQLIGCDTQLEFQLKIAEVAYKERPIRRGPKVIIPAVEFEGSSPKKVTLTAKERQLIEQALVTRLRLVCCLFSWHYDPKKERDDFHCLTPNEDTAGHPLTSRAKGNLLFRYRAILDEVHNDINLARLERKDPAQPHIPTMIEIRSVMHDKGRDDLIQRLAESGMEFKPENVVGWIKSQGMMGRKPKLRGLARDYISVVYKPGCQPKRENLAGLIADSEVQRRKLKKQKETQEALLRLHELQRKRREKELS